MDRPQGMQALWGGSIRLSWVGKTTGETIERGGIGMTNQNKAHAVNVGSVYKPIGKSGLINVASNGAIINHFSADETGNLGKAAAL